MDDVLATTDKEKMEDSTRKGVGLILYTARGVQYAI